MKKFNLISIFIFVFSVSFACTIGVASSSVTTDERALIWKNRDVGSPTIVQSMFIDSLQYNFIGVGSENSTYIWMGVNEAGFGIVNSIADFDRLPGNGDMMKWALGSCANMQEFDTLLNQTNITGRETHTNYGVLDSSGAAKMYEVSENEWWVFDADENGGFVVRGNSAYHGGAGEQANHPRSTEIISELIDSNQLNCSSVLHNQIRDITTELPFEDGDPYGYYPLNGINNTGNKSAVVIQGILENEPAEFTTMWSLLHQPSATIAVPCFPSIPPSVATNSEGQAPLHYFSQEIYNQLFDIGGNNIDTFKLTTSENDGFWDEIFDFEDEQIATIDSLKNYWNTNGYSIEEITIVQEEIANNSLNFIENFAMEIDPVINFVADTTHGYYSLDVNFTDTSLHNPEFTNWEWEWDDDDMIDSFEQNPSTTFSQPGVYSVALTATNVDGSLSISKEDYIIVEEFEPNFEANFTMGIAPIEISFTNLSNYFEGLFAWDFDNDGNIDSTEENPIWVFGNPGEYSVSLTISDGEYSQTFTKDDYLIFYENINEMISVIPDSLVFDYPENIAGAELNFQNITPNSIDVLSLNFANYYYVYYLDLPYTIESGENLSIIFTIPQITQFDREYLYDLFTFETNYGNIEIDVYVAEEFLANEEDAIELPIVNINAYPNPFNPSTKISFEIPEDGLVSLKVSNILGQQIRTLVSNEFQSGKHTFEWDGKNNKNRSVGSGIYFCTLRFGNTIKTIKLVLLK